MQQNGDMWHGGFYYLPFFFSFFAHCINRYEFHHIATSYVWQLSLIINFFKKIKRSGGCSMRDSSKTRGSFTIALFLYFFFNHYI